MCMILDLPFTRKGVNGMVRHFAHSGIHEFEANLRNLLELQQILSLNDFNIKSGCSYIFLQKFIP